jgi:hypothetical protein
MEDTMEVLSLIKGTDRTVRVSLRWADGSPVDLTSATSIKALFQQQEDSENLLELETGEGGSIEIVGDASRGQIDIDIDSENSALLRTGERLSWEVEVSFSDAKYVCQFREGLDVIERLQPI